MSAVVEEIVLGCLVRRVGITTRAGEHQGIVIEVDRYRDRDTLVRVQFQRTPDGDRPGAVQWVPRDQLVRFGDDYTADWDELPVFVGEGDVTYLAPASGEYGGDAT